MSTHLRDLLHRVTPDPIRADRPLSAEVAVATEEILVATPDQAGAALARWLARHQPCLFGRIAAKQGLLTFCVLPEALIETGDAAVRDAIQECRLEWTAAAFRGRKSGFVILVQSRRLALGAPDLVLREFSQRLASLYLLEDVAIDKVHTDEVFLEAPGGATWRWDAGVNFFGTQGDRRWWQDHRIPGGVSFSVNSVGHLVKSGALARAMTELSGALQLDLPEQQEPVVDTIPKALDLAMRTINMAARTEWGLATELLPLPADRSELPVPDCPARLPGFLQDRNHCEYAGWYHTDHTVPSVYFEGPAERTGGIRYSLDFTYLFHDHIDNPDQARMGAGVRIRADQAEVGRSRRTAAVEMSIEDNPRLIAALERYPS